ncbi:MAG: metal-dependent transcriptional regulator [Anaerolineales bacterium]|jgi:DtxR family Mn-dependent transcriptional regulator
MQSENAEMYLVSLALIEESGQETPIPIPRLAEVLDVQTVSANQMIRKLEEEGLVTYQPYKGVSFTDAGSQAAHSIIRNRRLWEVFFVDKLNFTPSQADELACRMEHITEPEVAARLTEFLGHPITSPAGKHIPSLGGLPSPIIGKPLNSLQPGNDAEILQINVDTVTSAFLNSEILKPGSQVTMLAVSSNGSVLVSIGEHKLSLAPEIASQILVAAA